MPAHLPVQYSPMPPDEMEAAFAAQRAAFAANPMPSAAQRLQWLEQLGDLLSTHRQTLIEAISQDFSHRSADETRLAELLPSLLGIRDARKQLKRWMKPSRRHVGLVFQPASAKVVYQPLGVIGVIVPWNYPLFLAVGPLIGALAAGNRVMLKLSESTPATGALLQQLFAKAFAQDLITIVLGEADVGMAFSRLPFDHLLFTGATSIGKHVMRAAAENLTPVTLELGGKSPAIVSHDVPLADAAERIAFGKTLNAGQTCIAPDYVLVPEDRIEDFVKVYSQTVKRFYPQLTDNPDYTAIINERQLARLTHYLDDAALKGATVINLYEQGQARRMPFSVLLNVSDDMLVMQDEIFGPLLPIVPYDTINDALAYINRRPRPLALYYFGYNRAEQQHVLEHTHSGGVSINDTLMHAAQDDLPFGGIGPSGMGRYHGREGFHTFSQAKAVFIKQRFNAARLIYPPYGKALQRLVYKIFLR